MTTAVLSPMQEVAKNKIVEWFNSNSDSFVLAGYAGTGKTFMMNEVVQALDIKHVVYATFTGKASLVLRRKLPANSPCMTLHKFMYEPSDDGSGNVTFSKKPKTAFDGIELVVVDECSMVSEELLTDLMSLDLKVLFVGDHGQLPPVGKVSDIYRRLNECPDAVLTEIHRQAEGNPIIHLSMLAREKKAIPYGKYGNNVLVVPKGDVEKYWKSIMNADQVICGYNKTRQSLNQRMRNSLGFKGATPQVGEKVICLRNNWGKGNEEVPLVNGLIGNVDKVQWQNKMIEKRWFSNGRMRTATYQDKRRSMKLTITPDFSDKDIKNIDVLENDFLGVAQGNDDFRNYDSFDFGYAITCHKSQGSEWEKVFVFNEVLNRDDHHRWLYTAITRASKFLILAL